MVVDVAMDSPKGLESLELFCCFNVPDITGMPNLVHIFEEAVNLGDNDSMSVR